jgi:hypothetical protein
MERSGDEISIGLEPWLSKQEIGVAAYFSLYHYKKKSFDESNWFQVHLEKLLKKQLEENIENYPGQMKKFILQSLPSTLNLLDEMFAYISGPNLSSYLRKWREELWKSLRQLEEIRRPLLGNAKIIAHYMLYSEATASRVVEFGKSRIGHTWTYLAQDPERVGKFEMALNELRKGYRDTASILRAITAIGQFFSREHPSWLQVESFLISHAFCWPLLVFGKGEEKEKEIGNASVGEIGISLPVAIDVSFDGGSRVFIEQIEKSKVIVSEWKSHLEKAVECAKKLWRSKHGNYGGDFRKKVQLASVTFDFRFVEEIIKDMPSTVPISEGSADAYFAQAVLARMLGHSSYISSVATGIIGEQTFDEEGNPNLDFQIEVPGGVIEKLSYVFSAGLWERIALPRDDNLFREVGRLLLENPKSQTAEIAYGGKLSNFADIMQIQAWRQFRYIRCPELTWALHGEGPQRILEPSLPQVRYVLDRLNSRRSSVLDLRQDGVVVSPIAVASALWHINTTKRLELPYLFSLGIEFEELFNKSTIPEELRQAFREKHVPLPGDAFVERINGSKWRVFFGENLAYLVNKREEKLDVCKFEIPPSLSWLFVRAIDEEQDLDFWHVVYKAIGASFEAFEHLRYSSSIKKAVNNIAEILNRFRPLEACLSHRAPDIIVIIGPERFEKFLEERTSTPLMWNLSPPYILKRLATGDYLEVSPDVGRMKELLGRTRIILVPDCCNDFKPDDLGYAALNYLDYQSREVLGALATFRWAFTHQMAAIFFDELSGRPYETKINIHDFLERHVNKKVLCRGQGWYHIPPPLRAVLRYEIEKKKERCLIYHLAAGTALAPYTTRTPLFTLPLTVTFLPEYVHEAAYHLRTAFKLAQVQHSIETMRLASRRMGYLYRFAALPSWMIVHELAKGKNVEQDKLGYEMAKDFLETQQKEGIHTHPGQFLNAAQCTIGLIKRGAKPDEKVRLHEELVGGNGFFPMALKACENPTFKTEKIPNLLVVLSSWAEYLADQDPENEKITELDLRVWELINQPGVIARPVRGRYFERLGDETEDHRKASDIYYCSGLQSTPDWYPLWIKSFGALRLATANAHKVLEQLKNYAEKERISEEELATRILIKCIADYRREKAKHSGRKWVIDRWYAGLKYFSETWKNSLEVRARLCEYDKLA